MTTDLSILEEMVLPEDAYPFLNKTLQRLLNQIDGDEAEKMRYTAILYGVARATPGVREDSIFDRKRSDAKRICARSTWYEKWKNQPHIKAIWTHVQKLCGTYQDAETLRIEKAAQQLLRRSIAEGQVDAVMGLRRTTLSVTDRADYRTDASKTLLALGSEELAARLAVLHPGTVPIDIVDQPKQVVKLDVSGLPAEFLRAIADEGAGGAVTDRRAEGAGPAASN